MVGSQVERGGHRCDVFQRQHWRVLLISWTSEASEGKGDIRGDGVGSGLSIWVDDGVIALNVRLGGVETF